MKRRDFQELAAIRLKEAKVLLDASCWDGAYYLGGYVVECALKACIARQTERFDFPNKKRVLDSYTHDLQELIRRISTRTGPLWQTGGSKAGMKGRLKRMRRTSYTRFPIGQTG